MITSPVGSQQINVHGAGPQGETMSLAQFRDAVGYSKQSPLPARKVTLRGVVKLAGSTVAVNTTGVLDGDQITGLADTDGLLGAAVTTEGLPAGATVVLIPVVAAPGQPGTVLLSNVAPFAPTSGVPQPVVFTAIVQRGTISGLPSTVDLAGAKVSGGGLPDGSVVQEISVAAVPSTNMQPGATGEVVLVPPVVVAPKVAPSAALLPDVALTPGAPIVVPPKPPVPVVRSAAVLTPVDVTFEIPTAPIVFPDGVSFLQLSPPEPIAALPVTLAAEPVDGQLAYIYSTLEIGKLTVLANVGQILNWSPLVKPVPAKDGETAVPPFFKLAADTRVGFLYSASNTTWDRIQ